VGGYGAGTGWDGSGRSPSGPAEDLEKGCSHDGKKLLDGYKEDG